MQGKSGVDALAGLIAARIGKEAQLLAAQWNHPEGTRARHFVLDDLLHEADAPRIFASSPRRQAAWFQRHRFRERKKTFANLDSVDPLIGHITDAFHRREVLQAVKDIAGIDGLEADPELYAGGISMMG